MRVFLILCSIFFVCFQTDRAYSLDCASPKLNKDYIEKAQLIFKGVPVNERTLTKDEAKLLQQEGLIYSGSLAEYLVYEFEPSEVWKGADANQNLVIVRNTYWGDTFEIGDEVFIMAEYTIEDLYITDLCGISFSTEIAVNKGYFEILNKFFKNQK
jgi:hypothetical protein